VFSLTKDESLFKRFYDDEQTYPRHFQESNNTWGNGWDDFKAFCDKCERIYSINGTALVYAERIDDKCNLHFSIIRGTNIDLAALITIRDDLLASYGMLFAYVGSHNRGLRKIVEQLDMVHNGIEMRVGETHGKVIIWQLFTVSRNSLKNKGFDSIITST